MEKPNTIVIDPGGNRTDAYLILNISNMQQQMLQNRLTGAQQLAFENLLMLK